MNLIWSYSMSVFGLVNELFGQPSYICVCASGVMVIVVGNGHGDTSSNPGRD